MRLVWLPFTTVAIATAAMLVHGPIAQLAHYHEFADSSHLFGIPHAMDVLSNLGFGIMAGWGAVALLRARRVTSIKAPPRRYGYALFLLGLFLTAVGSSYYHLAPDDARLVWDRLPIALVCAGLLAAVRAETHPRASPRTDMLVLVAFACLSVMWWRFTGLHGTGDLRPYLLLQGLPLILIPLWQWIYRAPAADRMTFAMAIALYIAAKAAELHDHELLSSLGWISGHTLKHLLSTAAAGVIVQRLVQKAKACGKK